MIALINIPFSNVGIHEFTKAGNGIYFDFFFINFEPIVQLIDLFQETEMNRSAISSQDVRFKRFIIFLHLSLR